MTTESAYIFPASFAQRRLWFLDQLEPGNSAYHLTTAPRLRGALNVNALEQSLNEIVNRHEALRTRFEAIDGEPMQVVEPPAPLQLNVELISGLEAAAARVNQQNKEPFDLKCGPLFRVALLQLAADDHVLLLTMHHIIGDGWSLSILYRELGQLYEAYCHGHPSPLAELPIQYADFSVWQHEYLQGEVLSEQLSYWKDHLAGAPDVLQLPADSPRPAVRTFHGEKIVQSVSAEVYQSLMELCRAEGATPFMALMTAFQILLHRQTGQEDVVVGFPIAGRNREEIEPLIGFFVNTLVLRTNMTGKRSFRELLAKVRESALSGHAHQDLPFEKLVETLAPTRDVSQTPLFQVFFNVINTVDSKFDIPGLAVEHFAQIEFDSKFDLTLYCIEAKDELHFRLVYNVDLFKPERMSEMLAQFNQLLAQVVQNPAAQIDSYSLVTPAAAKHLPDPTAPLNKTWNGAVQQHFSRQAQNDGARIAVSDERQSVSYADLEARSNQLAHYLIAAGVDRQEIVAIYAHRSASLVWAMLGVLKAGAAFVVLDPAYPATRLINQLRVAQPKALVQLEAAGELPGALAEFAAGVVHLVLPRRIAEDALASYPTHDPAVEIDPEDLAYVAFTSGSTGTPKGIMGGHRPLSHFVDWHCRRFDLNERDRFVMLSGLAHDPLLRDIFTPLSLGATLLIPDSDDVSLDRLASWMKQNSISVSHLTPAMLRLVSDERIELPALRYAFIGGDVVPAHTVRSFRQIAPAAACVNFYGTTETPQAIAYFAISPEQITDQTIPLGQGIDDVQLLVMNSAQQLAGLGEAGEICVRTPYLAKGYLGDEQLTAGRFVVNPFTGDAEDKLYRTGDQGRYRLDGTIEFLGRLDQQVKLRGFRIELGEIEATLTRHESIRDAVVVVREEEPGDKRLVAYVVTDRSAVDELREWLQDRLPEYMVPANFVELDHLPLTANGKIDRKALPAPPTRASSASEYVAPGTPVEEEVINIWREVLKADRVGVHDNFFTLGGHSLLATQVVSKLRKSFRVEVALRSIFEAPTPAKLAKVVERLQQPSHEAEIVEPIARISRAGELPLSFAQQRLWFLDQLHPGSGAYNMPAAVRLRGQLDVAALARSLDRLVARHEGLRTYFPMHDGRAAQVIREAEPIKLATVNLSEETDAEQSASELLQAELRQPFDLEHGPVFRSRLIKLSENEHLLVLVVHHIVADGLSLGLLMRELWRLYSADVAGREANLSELPVQYVDYAVWQRRRMQGDSLERQLNYWLAELGGAPRVLTLATAKARSVVPSYQGATRKFYLSRELTAAARQLSRSQGVTLFMLLLAAFKVLLFRYSGQADLVVGSPIAGRNVAEVEGLIGLFANTLALRTNLSGNPTFQELLASVRDMSLRAYTHQDVPFELLVDQLQPERDLSHNPLFQVMFALQNPVREKIEVPGLELSYLATDRETSKFDLTLSMIDSSDQLAGNLEYKTDLFDAETIDRMAGHFQELLEAVVADPSQRVGEVELLSAAERRQLLAEFNEAETDYSSWRSTIHEQFEAQVERTPEAVAVRDEEQELSYRELNRRANQVAHYLRRQGVGPEVLVGVLVRRRVELLVGLLGVLKAGGAYVPLDAAYPEERLRFMMADTGMRVLLSEEQLRERVSWSEVRVVSLDGEAAAIADESAQNPASGVETEHLAYVIYTSGSTGRPKGVAIAHRSATVFLRWAQATFSAVELQGMLASTSICFDLSVFEMFAPLSSGGCVRLAENALALPELRGREAVSLVNTVPSALAELLRVGGLPASVKAVNLAGEALPQALVEQIYEQSRVAVVRNLYGPSEATTYSTWTAVERGAEVTIGRPVRGTQVYVLDERQQLAPVGVSGELYIGGEGLARGYLGRAAVTAEKFVPHPYSVEAGARLYRTGDVGRYRADGEIEYQGRRDQQVKVRGYRIELGEIEAVLRQSEAIREAVVTVREDEPGEKRLVAYVVGEREWSVRELREWLKEQLPEYMVPAVFVGLAELPLTANGKVDRKALPAPDGARPALEEEFVIPSTPVEQQLAEIWSQVLGVEQVGVDDNFFELGGDSILSIQIVARANQAGIRFTPQQLFQHQTIAELAGVITVAPVLEAEQGLVTGPVQLTPIQHWFFEQDFAEPHHWNQARLLDVKQAVDPILLRSAVNQLLLHHDGLRLRFFKDETGWKQVNAHEETEEVFTHVSLSGSCEDQIATIETQARELQASLDLTNGPLVRVRLFESNELRRLLIVIHHLAVDGVSWRILLDDLQTAYQQATLPKKTTSFQQWSESLKTFASSPDLAAETPYWLANNRADVKPLRRDFAAGENSEAFARQITVSLTAAETEALLREVPAVYRTQINDVLLTALVQALNEWDGESSRLIDLEGHGREQIIEGADLSRTTGWFTTIFPVLLEVNPTNGPGAALQSIKEQLRAVPNRGIGYGILRYLGDHGERLQALPQAEIVFNYQGQFDQILSQSSLFASATESAGPIHSPRAKRRHLLSVNGAVINGQLKMIWTYGENIYERQTIAGVADGFITALQSLIAHCQSPEAGGYTPSDFPVANLDQESLSRLAGRDPAIEDIYTLSPMQQGILFHALYARTSDVYTIQLNYTLRGKLDVAAFKESWQTVVNRHAILRTAFAWQGLSEPVQIVHKNVNAPWEQLDYSGVAPVEQRQRLQAFLEADKARGFDLTDAPLVRLTVIQFADDEYRAVWSIHNLLLDGWSLALVMKEVFSYYEAFGADESFRLKPPRPYRDYIAWSKQQSWTEAERFWRETLKGFSAPTPLGVDQTVVSTGAYEADVITLSSQTTAALRMLARRQQLTLNTIVQGAWALLLHRYSGEDDIVFGATVSGRPPSLNGIESMVGVFINTLPVRIRVPQRESLLSWLKALQEQQVKVRQFEHTPLMQVQAWSDALPGAPLFETIFVFENYPVKKLKGRKAQLKIEQVQVRELTHYAISVLAGTSPNLTLKFLYDCKRFDAATIDRMAGHFQELLEAVVADPSQRVGEVELLSAGERRQLLAEFNEAETDYRGWRSTIHEQFEAQVERTPEAVAVRDEEQELSYRELNRRANQVAHYLRRQGVGPEVLVGVLVRRRVELLVGLLGVLKAGGAYVPLDAAYPEERLRFMMADTGMRVLLSEESLRERVSWSEVRVVSLDGEAAAIAGESGQNPASGVETEHLAYVIYTSGSTGRPKGVAIAHRSATVFLRWAQATFSAAELQGMLASTSICFDLSVFELFAPLSSGGCVRLAENALALPELRGREAVSLVNTVPSALAELLRVGGLPASVKAVNLAGEALPQALVEQIYEQSRVTVVRNLYGPSEATTYSTWTAVERGAEVTIGRPVRGTQVYVLDERQQLAPVGVSGELYIGGEGLARGYLGRAAVTAEKFVPHPYSVEAGARLYRTGDVGRYRADGEIEYQGRRDQQVKVRGYRIELGEIEAVLRQSEAIREAVVTVREDEPGEKRLVAYVVGEREWSVRELREWLKEQLPEYMVPAVFVGLAELPLTANGKVDRKALPAPDGARPALEEGYVAPRTVIEEEVAAIWSEVLKVEQVGANDNFFDLGGDSLKAIQVASRVQDLFETQIPLRSIFENPKLGDLCALLGPADFDNEAMAQLLGDLETISEDQARALLLS